ncbi:MULTISPECIES: Lrp/AsnC family transcriptional regulator [unclassified Mycolicibacterium]|uniref:Lrp/AsnC family transcriptional regulator n=1 Tax=unclassified Mycolicibacterium TaxID=2636767 RepID=UPI001391708A|nr:MULTISPECIES: Lrp/AsnC family transcriptional regulator [unclassified Mycolicibacterium]
MSDKLDELDRSILTHLQEDGRKPFREIGRALQVAEATVRTRVKRLQTAGLLNIVAYVDPMQMGSYTLTLLLVVIEPDHHADAVELLMQRPEVSYLASALSDRADLLVEFSASDDHQRWEFVNLVRQIPGVSRAEFLPIIRTHKFFYRLPTGQ